MDESLRNELTKLKERGLTFSDCVDVFGVERDTDPQARKAFEIHHREGEVEIDSTTVISESSEGAYVMAWVWVDDPDSDD